MNVDTKGRKRNRKEKQRGCLEEREGKTNGKTSKGMETRLCGTAKARKERRDDRKEK